jgi:D-lactate dehydrogenase (cytochrome)
MKNESLQNELINLLGDRFSDSISVRGNYSGGEDVFDPILSQAVVFPKNNEEISSIMKSCNKHKTPIVSFGTGTSLEGNALGNENGITLSLEKMNKILSVNEDDFDCRVQAYVTRKQLNEELKSKGVFFPIDPGADASLGGMTATSASGTMAVRYGTMRNVVSGLTVILANGDIIKTGTRSKKTAAGYNLTNLFVGSEGTLGIISEIQLRLNPIPESIMSAICQFNDLESAVLTAQQIIQYGVSIARIEMLNKDQMDISIKYSSLENLDIKPTLFFEFHGSENTNNESIEVVESISNENNGSKFKWAKTTEERNKLWQARHDVYYSVKAEKSNIKVYTTDICVPISNLVEAITFAEKEIQNYGLRAPMVGHVGDGNFHVAIQYDPKNKKSYNIIRKFSDKLIDKAIDLEGTITGEHGVGVHKKEYLIKQHSDNIPYMKLIKKTLDPNNIMNPGKIFD